MPDPKAATVSAAPPAGELDSLAAIREQLRRFADERDWNRFHAPKNLALALIVEAAEVVEHFQWADAEAPLPDDKKDAVALELADVLFYLVRLADRLDVDLAAAAATKLARNAERYPAARVRGSARKYNEY